MYIYIGLGLRVFVDIYIGLGLRVLCGSHAGHARVARGL